MSMNLIVKFKDMKYILLATLLCGMFSSCTENLSGQRQSNSNVDSEINTWVLKPFMFEDHQYLRYTNGGIIHSESCKCKEAKK
jgi:hypothetical protein